jgi:hypothetical protein
LLQSEGLLEGGTAVGFHHLEFVFEERAQNGAQITIIVNY